MEGHWAGPIPIRQFLDSYFESLHTDILKATPTPGKDHFSEVFLKTDESERYKPFVDAITDWIPGFRAVNTGSKSDESTKLKTDVALYKESNHVPTRTDFKQLEMWVEFKRKTLGDPFDDPSEFNPTNCNADTYHKDRTNNTFTPHTIEARRVRGQLTAYAGAHHGHQFRHFSFSVFIAGETARFIRWDNAGAAVTQSFNFRKQPEILAEFFWNFSDLSDPGRGHDTSVRPAKLSSDVNTRVRKEFKLEPDVPLLEYDLPGLEGHAYGPLPPYPEQSLVVRCSRTLPVYYIPTRPGPEESADTWKKEGIVFLKDTWRFLPIDPNDTAPAEHEIYARLHDAEVPNIPGRGLVVGGDVPDGRTRTQELIGQNWLCAQLKISAFQHHRLVIGVVGRELTNFPSTKELLMAVRDAVQAHWKAFQDAKLLHRDISVGNIIIYNDGGLLIDWEMAKDVDVVGNRRHDCTGTWQFMSAALLQDPGKKHDLTDDLESFLHVLGWTILRYLPGVHTYAKEDRRDDLGMFDETSRRPSDVRGGESKADKLRGGSYPSRRFKPKKPTPLYSLIRTLASPFTSFYDLEPPTEDDRVKYKVMPTNGDRETMRRWAVVDEYEQNMECLESSEWFLDKIDRALKKPDFEWPTDDKADPEAHIPMPPDPPTDKQMQAMSKRNQELNDRSQRSKEVPVSNKRPLESVEEQPSSTKRSRSRPL